MSYGWLGTFRQGSWQSYRSFILNERRDAEKRAAVIEAELSRIGEIVVFYASSMNEDGTTAVTEQRVGMTISPGTSLEKLMQAYVAQGGNPFDISLFLMPDTTILLADGSEQDQYPYKGIIAPQSDAYTIGLVYKGGYLPLKKYLPARTGGRVELMDSTTATHIDRSRRWTAQALREKVHDIEARIIKLCDLREQLLKELDALTAAMGGISPGFPLLDDSIFDSDVSVAKIVSYIDSIFYEKDDTGTPDFTKENTEGLKPFPFLMSDISPEEDNTAL